MISSLVTIVSDMQDPPTLMCAVLDGHGGFGVCSFVAAQLIPIMENLMRTKGTTPWDELLKNAFLALDREIDQMNSIALRFDNERSWSEPNGHMTILSSMTVFGELAGIVQPTAKRGPADVEQREDDSKFPIPPASPF
jgi:serine/threonine protein phosphatase PrpC